MTVGAEISMVRQFGSRGRECRRIHRYRDERLPKGPRFATESLDADTGNGPGIKMTHYRNLDLRDSFPLSY
jgi:hypothetical protein